MANERPALTVDAVVFGFDDREGGGGLEVLLIERGLPPSEGSWALPGGFVRLSESLDDAVRRELREETNLTDVYLEQLYTFGEVDRDPRERVVSVAYYALVRRSASQEVRAATDARRAAWFPVAKVPSLAFDHQRILRVALTRLEGKVRYEPIGFNLLPPKFKLSKLQHLYETILGRPLDKRNFRKKILGMGVLVELKETEKDVSHRAARLYRFDAKAYRQLVKTGWSFEI